jgi:subtilisin family serine protease
LRACAAGDAEPDRGRGDRAEWGSPLIDELEERRVLSGSPAVVLAPRVAALDLQLQPGAGLAQLTPLMTAAGATASPTTVFGLYEIHVSAAAVQTLAQELSESPTVQYAAAMQTVQAAVVPNDPYYGNGIEWGLYGTSGINAPAAWNTTTGSDRVIVADVDTGIDYNNPDLVDNVWLNQAEIPASVLPKLTDTSGDGVISFSDLNNPVNQGPGKIVDSDGDGVITGADVIAPMSAGGWASGSTQDGDMAHPDELIGWNFVAGSDNPFDDNGHGTHTAGILGAVGDNATGIAGVDWNVQVMPVKALDATGAGTDVAAAQGIDYAVNHGARVINASWGLIGTDAAIAAAIQYAASKGVIIVAAAGNNGTDDDSVPFSPASYSMEYPNVITVAATDANGALASWSDYGAGSVQLAAPGVNILSTLNGSYGYMSGTSMAAPFVTGTIALVEAAHPSWSMSQVEDAVLDHVTPDPVLAGEVSTAGIVNAAAAVANTDGAFVVSASPNGAGTSASPLVSIAVSFNEEINPATFTGGQISLAGPGGTIGGVSVTAVPGSNDHQFVIAFPAQTAGGAYTLKVAPDIQDWYGNNMDQNRNGVNGEAGDAFTLTIGSAPPAAPDVMRIAGPPATETAGTIQSFTVTALAPGGAVDSRYVGTITFSSTDPQAALPANYTFSGADAGVHTFAVTLKTAGLQSVTATDTGSKITATGSNISVTAAAPQSLAISGFPLNVTAGVEHALVVAVRDPYGNVVTGYAGTVELTSSDPQAVMRASYTFTSADAGRHTFAPTLKTAGVQWITFQDLADGLSATLSGIRVNPAALSALAVAGFPTADTAGASHAFTVTAVDAYGNVITSYTGTIGCSSSDPQAVLPGSYTFVPADAGTHSFSATLKTAGKQRLKAADAANTAVVGAEGNITVSAAAPVSMEWSGMPSTVTAGTQHLCTLTVHDLFGNVVTGYTGTVALTNSDPQATMRTSYTFTSADAGAHTFGPTLRTAGIQWIAATDAADGLSATLMGIRVIPAAVGALAVAGFPSPDMTGTSHAFTVTAKDAYGNVVTSYAGTVAFTSSDPLAALPARYTFTSSDAGAHIFTAALYTVGTQKLKTADAAGTTIAGAQGNIQVQAPAASPSAVSNAFGVPGALPHRNGSDRWETGAVWVSTVLSQARQVSLSHPTVCAIKTKRHQILPSKTARRHFLRWFGAPRPAASH